MFSKISETICDRLIRKITCISQFFFSMYVHGNFSVTTWCYSTQNWKPLPSASSTQILSAEASLWLFLFFLGFFGMHRNPFLIRQCHNGHRGGYALLKWLIRTAIWFEHSPFQKAETSNLPALVNLTIETHSVSFHFTRTAIENKKSWTNTTCIRKGKNIQEKNTLKHCCCRVLLGFQGDIRNIQKHMDTVDTRVLAIVWKELPFPIIEVEPHLFTLISIPDFVVTFGLNQHPLPANFFLSRHRSGTAP